MASWRGFLHPEGSSRQVEFISGLWEPPGHVSTQSCNPSSS